MIQVKELYALNYAWLSTHGQTTNVKSGRKVLLLNVLVSVDNQILGYGQSKYISL